MNPFVSIGVLINSALYLTGCFVAGLATGNSVAWRLALATAGVTYLAYVVQEAASVQRSRPTLGHAALALVTASIALGLLAGLALIGG